MSDGEYTATMEQLFANADVNGNNKLGEAESKVFLASVMKSASMTPEAISAVIDSGKFDTWPPCEDFMKADVFASMEGFMNALPGLKDDILKGCPLKPKEGDIQLFNDMSDPAFEHEIHSLFKWADADEDGKLNEKERKNFLESIMKAVGIN